jgi:hypothetical protein
VEKLLDLEMVLLLCCTEDISRNLANEAKLTIKQLYILNVPFIIPDKNWGPINFADYNLQRSQATT